MTNAYFRKVIEKLNNLFLNENALYYRYNFMFNITFRFFRVTPVLAVIYWYIILATAILLLHPARLLMPHSLWDSGSGLIENMLGILRYNNLAYLIGDKFSLVFYGVIVPWSLFQWLRHVLIIHPNAVENVAEVNNLEKKQYQKEINQTISNPLIEYTGIVSGFVAVFIVSFCERSVGSWKSANPLILILNSVLNFMLWYVMSTFIIKGLLLIVKKYFKLKRNIKYHYSLVDDPFQIKGLFKDILSVFFFILIGGFTLLLMFVFDRLLLKQISLLILGLYFLIFPFFIIRYYLEFRKLKERLLDIREEIKNRLLILNSNRSLTSLPHSGALQQYDQIYRGIQKARIIPVKIFERSIIIYILQLSILVFRLYGLRS